MAQMELQSGSHLLNVLPLTLLNMVSRGWEMHGNDMQMRLCIVKLGVVSSIYGDCWKESGWRYTYAHFPPDWDL